MTAEPALKPLFTRESRTALSPAELAAGELVPHPLEWPVYRRDALDRAAELLARGRSFDYDYGEELAELESAFAAYHGREHALAVTSGTASLSAAYFALGLGPGDEVIVPAFTFFSTASPLFLHGAVPVLCDADDVTGNVTAEAIAARITHRTAAIVVTHLWGHPCDMTPIRRLADLHSLALIEDCSHAHGSSYHGRPVGSFGDIAVFSIGGRKLVSGGLGGMLLTDEEDLYARACLLTNFRHRTDLTISAAGYEPFLLTGLGGNHRISPVAAVLAKSHFDDLDLLVRRRFSNVTALVDAVTTHPGISANPIANGCTMGAWYDGVVVVDQACPYSRDELAMRLQAEGLKVRAPATRPLHHYPLFRGAAPDWSPTVAATVRAAAAANDRPFPRAQALFERWLRLPVNFLWDEESSIVGPYVDAFDRVLAQPPDR